MQILIPMGGAGSRFSAAGYDRPKPFIEFHGQTMIENVVENLGSDNQYIFVTQRTHYEEYRLVYERIRHRVQKLHVAVLDGMTQGAAESCLHAKEFLDPEMPLMIANCDQMLEWNPVVFKAWLFDTKIDGAIMTFESQSPKNSFARLDDDGYVVETAEKKVISPYATNGIYVWKRAEDFTSAAEELIIRDLRTNNEFYVAPVFNLNIEHGQKIKIYPINGHWPIGTPQDLTIYLDRFGGKRNASA